MVTFGSVKEREYTLLEQGEYILTLNELEESEGQWGDRMVWKFLVAPTSDFSAYICRADGNEMVLWTFTDRDIILGSLAHEFAQTLAGRTLGKDSAPPDEEELIGKRLLAYVTHETPTRGKNAGKKREAIVAGSIKPFRGPAKKVAPNVIHPELDEDEQNRATLIAEAERWIGKAVKLLTPSHPDWVTVDLNAAADDALHMLIRDAKAEVQAALDA